jgi:hypothetical protein
MDRRLLGATLIIHSIHVLEVMTQVHFFVPHKLEQKSGKQK